MSGSNRQYRTGGSGRRNLWFGLWLGLALLGSIGRAAAENYRWIDGARLLAQQTAMGNSEVIWLQGAAIGRVDAQGLTYQHNNHLMGAQAVSDGQGNGQWQPHPAPGQSAAGSLLQTPGQYLDENTGQHYNLARYYDPETGRYNRPDPAGKLMSDNLYVHGRSNPVRFIDRMGTCIEAPLDAALTGIGLGITVSDMDKGNWWAFAADVVGNVYDGFAAFVPCVPSGAVAAMTLARSGIHGMPELASAAEKALPCAACANAGVNAAQKIQMSERMVLGFSEVGIEREHLSKFARKVKGLMFGSWSGLAPNAHKLGQTFKAEFLEAAQTAKEICFSLDGFSLPEFGRKLTEAEFRRLLRNGVKLDLETWSRELLPSDGYYVTYSELFEVMNHPEWLAKTKFYLEGKVIALEDFLRGLPR